MEKKDIPYLSTAELADLIRQKEVSPVEVTESYLERIAGLKRLTGGQQAQIQDMEQRLNALEAR